MVDPRWWPSQNRYATVSLTDKSPADLILYDIIGAYHLTEKSGRGVESIIVLKRFTSLPQNCHIRYGLNPGANLCSVSLEPRNW